MSFDEEGNLYAAENGLFGSNSRLYLIDKSDVTWSTVGDLGVGNTLGLVFGSCLILSVCDIQLSQPTPLAKR